MKDDSNRHDLIWGYAFIAIGLVRTIASLIRVNRHFTTLDLVFVGIGILFIAYGIQRVRQSRTD